MALGNRGGRPAKPIEAHILGGTFRADRHAKKRNPQPKRGRPTCPAWLDLAAKKKWRQLVPELDRLNMLTIVDGDMLACFCVAWSEHLAATELLAKEGHIVKNEVTGAIKPHPAIAMQRSAWQALRSFGALFGLDPSSRARLDVPLPEEDDSQSISKFARKRHPSQEPNNAT